VLVRAESRWPRREIRPPNKKSVMGEKLESSQERRRSLGAGIAITPNPPLEPTTSVVVDEAFSRSGSAA
jgi:hypothetical protein